MSRSRVLTSPRDQLNRWLFWLISMPETATPPALAAFPGMWGTLAFARNFMAAGVLGMFAPSAIARHPPSTRRRASASSSSFCVAQGKARSQGTAQGRPPAWKSQPNSFAYSSIRPRRVSFRSRTQANLSASIPSGSCTNPEESESVTTFAPMWMSRWQQCSATFPEPETTQVLPSRSSFVSASISSIM